MIHIERCEYTVLFKHSLSLFCSSDKAADRHVSIPALKEWRGKYGPNRSFLNFQDLLNSGKKLKAVNAAFGLPGKTIPTRPEPLFDAPSHRGSIFISSSGSSTCLSGAISQHYSSGTAHIAISEPDAPPWPVCSPPPLASDSVAIRSEHALTLQNSHCFSSPPSASVYSPSHPPAHFTPDQIQEAA